MPPRVFPAVPAFLLLSLLAGCASGPTDSGSLSVDEAREKGLAADTAEKAPATKRDDSPRESASAESRRERTTEVSRDRPAATSSSRGSENRSPDPSPASASANSSDTAKLIAQLNEATRELATLRAANAKLSAERPRPNAAPTREAAVKADPADEKLAASLKSYAQFKQEMAAFLAEMERARKENADLKADLKDAAEQVKHAKSGLARLEDELRVEKRARSDAERTVAELREQLRSIARALSAAGLSAEKLTAGVEPESRSRASGSR